MMRARFVNETLNFEKKKDPLSSLGVGKIHLITKWLDEMEIRNYTINDNLTIDVNYDVWLNGFDLYEFPDYINFDDVNGDFMCSFNHLSSLRGCPKHVAGDFYCRDNAKRFDVYYINSLCEVAGKIVNI